MFATASKEAKNISPGSLKEDRLLQLPSGCLPEIYSFAQIINAIPSINNISNQEAVFEQLLLLNSCLTNEERLQRDDGDDESINKLSLWIAQAILPDGRMILNDDSAKDSLSTQRSRAIHLARHKGVLGLSCLKHTIQISSKRGSRQLDSKIFISILAFTSARDSWTTPAARDLAQTLLSSFSVQTHSKKFIIDDVIQSFIRPLFSKSKSEAITSTGRKAMPTSAPPRRHDIAELDHASKPWKYEAPYSVTIFSWAVENASQEVITAHWNMFIPPLLTLLDTPTTSILVRGLETLSAFLPKFSSKLLQQTGLGEVFEDSVMPTLLYLPSITPIEESVQILPVAFQALFILVDVRYPIISSFTSTALTLTTTKSKTSSANLNTPEQRLAFLDRIMRKGILTAHLHASEQHQITTILLGSLSTVISKMGIQSVKHLKDILPILTQVLTDPFVTSRPKGLKEGVKCLQTVMLNAWSRLGLRDGGHAMEVVRMLVVCWRIVRDAQEEKKIEEEKAQILKEVKGEFTVVGRLLVKAIEAVDSGVDVREELKPLLAVDPSLGDVFGIEVHSGSSTG